MKKLLWLGCLSYLTIGVAHVIGGSILEQMMAHYGLAYKDGGQWIMNQFMGFLVGVLLGPTLTARIGKRGTVLLALGLLTISEAAYSLFLPWGWMLAIAPLAGFGFGMTEAVVGAMIIDLVKNGKAAAMSRLEIFFGLGALLIPLGAAYLIQQQAWQLAFPILAAVAGITFVLWLTQSFGDEVDEEIAYKSRAARVKTEDGTLAVDQTLKREGKGSAFFGYPHRTLPFLLLSSLFFMLYVGMEMSFSNYLPSILIEGSGIGDANAAAALSLFWGAMVAGRLFAGALADRMGYGRYLLLAVFGAAVVFILLALAGTLSWTLVLVALSGLFFSGVFGIALVYANGMIPGMTERTTSILVACGGLGGAVFPRLTGWLMDRYTVTATLWFIGVLVLVIFLLLIMMLMLGRKQGNAAAQASS